MKTIHQTIINQINQMKPSDHHDATNDLAKKTEADKTEHDLQIIKK